jgi:hypothetical protein
MTGLHRTPLTTSQKIEGVAKALAGPEGCGGIAGLRSSGVSRPTVYAAKGAALEVLREHFEEPQSDPRVWVKGDSAQLRRTVVGLRVRAPNALRPLEEMIPIIYPGVRLSYGKLPSRAAEAEARATLFNAKADLSGVRAGVLDELFSPGEPVLGGVDLDSGYVFGLALRETRGGEDWAEGLKQGQEQGLNLAVVVKDAAGIESGVREVFPQAEQRDDCFHALYELTKGRRRLEHRAYSAIAAEEEAPHQLPKTPASDPKQRRGQRHRSSCPPPLPRGYRPV